MKAVRKKYIVDEKLNKVAVQVDIKDFERMEQVIEDYALGQYIQANDFSENLTLAEAKEYYKKLAKPAKDAGKGQ